MSDPQSLLQPGETLGAVQAQQPSNSLLQPGETLGDSVQQDTPVFKATTAPADNTSANTIPSVSGSEFAKGAGSEVAGMAESAATHSGLTGSVRDLLDWGKGTPAIIQAYENARSQGRNVVDAISAANAEAKRQLDARDLFKQRAKEFHANPSKATGRALVDVAAIIAPMAFKGAALPVEAAESSGTTADAVTHVFDPESGTLAPITDATEPLPQPSRITQAIKGSRVAQPGAQAAVRNAVRSSVEATGAADESTLANIENQPLLKGNGTILDEHLSNLAENEKAAYKKMDDTASFDVKAEKQQLANDQYKLKQLGNTDTDVTQRGNLIESINDSQQRIADAEAKMKEAGVDPTEADGIHKQRIAGTDFKKTLVKSTNPDGSVNIDSLLNGSKNLRFTKYGDRLQQFFGSKEAADNYITQLEQMQKLGAHAVKMQRVAKIIGGLALGGYGLHKFGQVAEALIP
jgi:hypothetical protein